MKKITFEIKNEDVGYSIQCLEVKGVMSQGDTLKEAIENVSEALIGYFETFGEKELTDSWKF